MFVCTVQLKFFTRNLIMKTTLLRFCEKKIFYPRIWMEISFMHTPTHRFYAILYNSTISALCMEHVTRTQLFIAIYYVNKTKCTHQILCELCAKRKRAYTSWWRKNWNRYCWLSLYPFRWIASTIVMILRPYGDRIIKYAPNLSNLCAEENFHLFTIHKLLKCIGISFWDYPEI